MRSMPVQIFLSCSFDPKDREVVDFFVSICLGLDMRCFNVDKGYVFAPPDKAREFISNSQALMAIATCGEEVRPAVFSMPRAVDQEISMAYANKKPIILFAEKGVDMTSGFIRNYSTYIEFDRGSLLSPAFLEKAIASIHGMKMEVVSPQELQLAQQGLRHVFVESIRILIELIDHYGSYTWRYSQTRRLRFTSRFTDPIKHAAWAGVATKGKTSSEALKWSYSIDEGTKPFRFMPTVEKNAHDFLQVSFDIDPKPEADDAIQYSMTFESPYLNPIYLEDVRDSHPQVFINGIKYLCFDGLVPIIRTQELKLQFRFPASLGLKPKDIAPFVGSYTNNVDYLVESEMKRMTVVSHSFGGNVVIDISIQNPLLQLIYGVAWNPPRNIIEQRDSPKVKAKKRQDLCVVNDLVPVQVSDLPNPVASFPVPLCQSLKDQQEPNLAEKKGKNISSPLKVFISYSRKDEVFKDELIIMLAGLQRRGVIDPWQDRRIEEGDKWYQDIKDAMMNCDLAILLVSGQFIASRFIQDEELPELLRRRMEEGLRVIPVIVKPCLWQSEPILKDIQVLPRDGEPVITFSKDNGARDQVWTDIAKAIEKRAK